MTEVEPAASAIAAVEIEAPDLCPRFCARVITGLTVRPSPPWLAQRLRAVGLRPINNLVDVTNYVMWELGQPLHAFDADKVAERRIVVRRARPGERITTLDGQTRPLEPDMAMVCDPTRVLAVGGVMGGADSEVTEQTTSVLLEAAYWDPGSIRRTSRALGLSTDAAYRFERGGDIDGLARRARPRGAAHGRARRRPRGARHHRRVPEAAAAAAHPPPARAHRARHRRLSAARRGGGHPPPARASPSDDAGDDLDVAVPSFRRDIAQEDDLVEEVVAHLGLRQDPVTLAAGRRARCP